MKSIIYKGIKYTVGDKLISENGYIVVVSIEFGIWGITDLISNTFCSFKNCDLSYYKVYEKHNN